VQRVLVRVAGPPGSGKSTLAGAVVEHLNASAMSGGHRGAGAHGGLSPRPCRARPAGLRAIKGAPATFEAAGFVVLVRQLREPGCELRYPLFDRVADRTLPVVGRLRAGTEVAVVEGNYLLLADGDWADLAPHFDVSVIPGDDLALELDAMAAIASRHGFSCLESPAPASSNLPDLSIRRGAVHTGSFFHVGSHQWLESYAPIRRSHEVRRISSQRDR
jgi:hypothetical protein